MMARAYEWQPWFVGISEERNIRVGRDGWTEQIAVKTIAYDAIVD